MDDRIRWEKIPSPTIDNNSTGDVHYERASKIIEGRTDVLRAAYEKHPERFNGRIPKPMVVPQEVWINKLSLKSEELLH